MQSQTILLFIVTLLCGIKRSIHCPMPSARAALTPHESEVADRNSTITLEQVKRTLKEKGIFDWWRTDLTDFQRKELAGLFDALEIMLTSRARQPSSAQSVFVSLRSLRRALDKQLREGQVSRGLHEMFRWEAFNIEDSSQVTGRTN